MSDPQHGSVNIMGTAIGSVAHYSCNEGYELSQGGASSVYCKPNGEWSSINEPVCTSKSCDGHVTLD